MNEVVLKKWKGVLWADSNAGGYIAFCPTHKLRLEIIDTRNNLGTQDSPPIYPQSGLICPEDNEKFSIFGDNFRTMHRRFGNYQESIDLKNAKVYDLDNIYTPILKVSPKPKDKRFSIQVEVDTTKEGKKLVIYAADREQKGKAQIFVDPQTDKISFDPNDVHPSTIFSKIEATFKEGKSATLEDKS